MGMLKATHKSCWEPLIFEYQYFVAETIKHTRSRFFCCCGGIFAYIGFYPAFQRVIKFFISMSKGKISLKCLSKNISEHLEHQYVINHQGVNGPLRVWQKRQIFCITHRELPLTSAVCFRASSWAWQSARTATCVKTTMCQNENEFKLLHCSVKEFWNYS